MIVCGLSLPSELRLSLPERLPGFRFEDYPAPALLQSSVCFPDLPLSTISDLMAYGLPVQIWAGNDVASNLMSIYNAGIAALHFPENTGIDPSMILKSTPGRALLFLGDPVRATFFRQIFVFAGIKARTDIRSAEELGQVLDDFDSSISEGEHGPLHVVMDLDRGDFLPALHALAHERNHRDMPLRVWALRDFSNPGPDPVLIQRSLSPFTTRVFDPHEAALALIEALLLYHPDLQRFSATAGPLQSFDGFRDAEYLLRGRSIQLLDRNPQKLYQALVQLMEHLRSALPFHWLYKLYEEQKNSGGVLLVDPERRFIDA